MASQVDRVGPSSYHNPLDLEAFGPSFFRGKRRKKLYPGDFVQVLDANTIVDICHTCCAPQLISILAASWDMPQAQWTTRSLKVLDGAGVPIKHDLHCVVCDANKPGWEYESKQD